MATADRIARAPTPAMQVRQSHEPGARVLPLQRAGGRSGRGGCTGAVAVADFADDVAGRRSRAGVRRVVRGDGQARRCAAGLVHDFVADGALVFHIRVVAMSHDDAPVVFENLGWKRGSKSGQTFVHSVPSRIAFVEKGH